MLPLFAALALAAPVDFVTIPPEAEILQSLRHEHPRLIGLPADLDRVRQLIASNDQARQIDEQLRRRAEQLLTAEPIVHRLIGPRLLDQSRRCLERVTTLATIYRLDGDRRFAERARREMLTAASFKDWNPAHFLDTAEMTNALALGYDWLYDFLSEEDRAAIRQAIVDKGLRPAEELYRSGKGWVKVSHNWNQVCNGGVCLGALAIADQEPLLAAYIVHEALRSVRLPMSRFDPDGGWDEGPGYWSYATIYNVYFLAGLESALGTDFGLSRFPGFDVTGDFRIQVVGPLRRTFNFADGGDRTGAVPQMFWLARKFNKPAYAWHARQFIDSAGAFDLWWFDPRGAGPGDLPLDRRFRNIDVVFLRSRWDDPRAIYVGFKGGDNRANHSHLELGTFVLDADGQRWAVDLGSDDYNLPGYFGKQRWTYYRLATEGQNTLLLNGRNQNAKAVAPIQSFRSTPQEACAVADLSDAYEGQAKRIARGVALFKRRQVLVQDEIEATDPADVVWAMHTMARVDLQGSRAVLTQNGETLIAQLLTPASARFEAAEVQIPPPQRPAKGVRKLLVRVKADAGEMLRLAVLLTPGKDQGSTPDLQPLARWR
jgi:hypothetical protein